MNGNMILDSCVAFVFTVERLLRAQVTRALNEYFCSINDGNSAWHMIIWWISGYNGCTKLFNKAVQVMHKEGYPLIDYSGYRGLLNIKSESQIFLCQILVYAH